MALLSPHAAAIYGFFCLPNCANANVQFVFARIALCQRLRAKLERILPPSLSSLIHFEICSSENVQTPQS